MPVKTFGELDFQYGYVGINFMTTIIDGSFDV
jgi:hypothetical protein